ncbi:unnamed protein product [Vitrella brassicaformis CCMP3155]|uniref:NEDD8-activating enzyme E1 regulatory subunit n=1 Tax=Vitrella brassicaformis (strain CCMP3155) TaxID=1169540 RepID=A0A0G4G654_VITBC|nr:unnamed protein product [Vitrella brassicaformis CCMP3155]|mmetsp:Transcript_39369/g.98488  ORF Transcript_39369/g.98488 Transcript_39369/m.98488 type:complete len:560 (-) Transcript_39369:410-2089(-)|eukprot:CEM23995.1 unnamed protein product [Vitrella brassicaformis CCMP3155]
MATDDKYDRQLRMWGPHGQKALAEASVCCVGSNAIATETLKNLVLPGVAHLTIVDEAVVESADLGQNFFVEMQDVGHSRAKAALKHLLELNPDVKGEAVQQSVTSLLEKDEGFFQQFTLIIAAQTPQRDAVALCELCHRYNKAFIHLRGVGFIGTIRLFAREHAVIETKNESDFGDLRLTEPFKELKSYAMSVDVSSSSMDEVKHAHVPYVVILLKALEQFRNNYNGRLPSTAEEKETFKQFILAMRRSDKEVNFDEALKHMFKAFKAYTIDSSVKAILDDAKSISGHEPNNTAFWIVAKAVAQFESACGRLPLSGTLPDMTADTDSFIKLQSIYRQRAEGDVAAVRASVSSFLSGTDGDSGAGTAVMGVINGMRDINETHHHHPTKIDDEYIQRFCKHAHSIALFRYRTLAEETKPDTAMKDNIRESYDEFTADETSSEVPWYLALAAWEVFREEKGYVAGAKTDHDHSDDTLAGDVEALKGCARRVCTALDLPADAVPDKYLQELVRYGGCELHTTASFLGGVASQEAVKLITKQWIPLQNTLIWNGLHSRGAVLEL